MPLWIAMPAHSMAASEPVPMAMPTSAAALPLNRVGPVVEGSQIGHTLLGKHAAAGGQGRSLGRDTLVLETGSIKGGRSLRHSIVVVFVGGGGDQTGFAAFSPAT